MTDSISTLGKRARRSAWALAALCLAGIVGWQLPWLDEVRWQHGLVLRSARVAPEVSPQEPARIELSLRAEQPLAGDLRVLIHWSGSPLSCNGYVQTKLAAAAARTRAGVELTHTLALPAPEGCAPGEISVFASIYPKGQSLPAHVLSPPVELERVLLGTTALVETVREREPVTRDGRALARVALFSPLRPWLPGLALFAFALTFALLARAQPLAAPLLLPSARGELAWLGRALPALVFLSGILLVLEHFKDDAFISFRYAHNFVQGRGLVFNPGERVEGITNLLWTLLLVPFEALGCDLLQVTEWLGAGCALGALAYLFALGKLLTGEARGGLSALWAALWLASSSSFVLYAHSGLEPPLAALLCCAGADTLYRARDAREHPGVARSYLRAGLLFALACLTRPELHLAALLLALPVWVDVVRARRLSSPPPPGEGQGGGQRSLTRAELCFVFGLAALTVPAHLTRYLYYGSLLPNTFYVKTSADWSVLRLGLDTLRELFAFNHTGFLLLLAPLALLDARRTLEKLAALAFALAFLAYYARVGVDEMIWHRLYLPALPFAALLAADGASNLLRWCAARMTLGDSGQRVLAGLASCALALWVFDNVHYTYDSWHGFDGRRRLIGTQYVDRARFLTRHERPGGLVAFQDMGAVPYHAPDLRFLDFVGLVDRKVARARHEHGLHAHVNVDSPAQHAFDADMRAYFYARDPAWTMLTVYVDPPRAAEVERAFLGDPTGAALAPFFADNPLQFALWDDPRFRQRYVPVRAWRHSAFYYLVLFRRGDLWQRTPGEIVFAAPPSGRGQAIATFAEGLELLGSELTPEARARHEVHVTSWWRLPGPRANDLTFRLHLSVPSPSGRGLGRGSGSAQVPISFDHIPGDWLYPAGRWQTGQILEDRTLIALTAELPPGQYQVSLSVYHRDSGEPLRVASGREAGRDRVALGSLRILPHRPLLDALIPRTDVTRERAHPERINDSR